MADRQHAAVALPPDPVDLRPLGLGLPGRGQGDLEGGGWYRRAIAASQ
jgi:hypothetical protein